MNLIFLISVILNGTTAIIAVLKNNNTTIVLLLLVEVELNNDASYRNNGHD